MLPAGLCILCASQNALAMYKASRLKRAYFDLQDMQQSNATGYFPYTPALPLMYGLIEAMKMLNEEGLDNVFACHHFLAEGVRAAITQGWQLKLCAAEAKWHSDTVSAVMLPEDIPGTAVIARAYRRYNLSLGGGLSKVAGKLFRIGHLGDMNEVHLVAAINGAEMAMLDCGVALQPGNGAAAAGNYWRSHTAPSGLGAPVISKDEHAKNSISGQAIIKS